MPTSARMELLIVVVAFVALLTPTFAFYDESLARYRMLPLSAAAYSSSPEGCLGTVFTDTTLFNKYHPMCDFMRSAHTCFGFTAVNHADRAIILAFRGTNNAQQLATEGFESLLYKMEDVAIGGGVSYYFWNGFKRIWNAGMRSDFVAMREAYPDYQVWITGHSLGGAFAAIAASVIVHEFRTPTEQVLLYTFGEPRVGNDQFAKSFSNVVRNSYRVTHNNDIVPHIPHLYVTNYVHHDTNVFYGNAMREGDPYLLCAGDGILSCGGGLDAFKWNIADHLFYFGKMISNYGRSNCTVDAHAITSEQAVQFAVGGLLPTQGVTFPTSEFITIR